jgi:hypothetical protein
MEPMARLIETGDPDLVLHEVVTDRLRLRFLPGVGGRLLALAIDGSELPWRNRGSSGTTSASSDPGRRGRHWTSRPA